MNDKQKKFLQENKFFSTSQATKVGFTRSDLKKLSGVTILGTYPIKGEHGHICMEKIYINDPELEGKVIEFKKSLKKINFNAEETRSAISEITNRIEGILYAKS